MLGTSTKLKTAKSISLTGDVSGSALFDGSKDVSIITKNENIKIIVSNAIQISGTSKTVNFDYPSGFNPYNCAVISCGIVNADNIMDFAYIYGDTDVNGNMLKCSVDLTPTKIRARITKSSSNNATLELTIILMKI